MLRHCPVSLPSLSGLSSIYEENRVRKQCDLTAIPEGGQGHGVFQIHSQQSRVSLSFVFFLLLRERFLSLSCHV